MYFSKDLCVGNKAIDSEHKKLLNIINGVNRSITAREVSVLTKAFDLLENSLCGYFVVEESIAQALNFDFNHHKLTHQNLLNRFKRIKDELLAKNGMWNMSEEEDYVYCLKKSMIHHIKEDCKPFKVVLSAQYYDFKPN